MYVDFKKKMLNLKIKLSTDAIFRKHQQYFFYYLRLIKIVTANRFE